MKYDHAHSHFPFHPGWGKSPVFKKPGHFPDIEPADFIPAATVSAADVITVIVVAGDGQIHSYKGPESGLKKWLGKLRRAGVSVGMKDLPR